jgi:hypothetical protein
MAFSSLTFLFYFLPGFLLLYYLLPWKNGVLLAGSLAFYAWGEPRFVPLLMASALINFVVGRAIAAARARRALWLAAGIGANLCMLVYFKYLGFFAELLNRDVAKVALPLGISFFTFQGISYLIEIYRKDIQAQSNLWRFAMYKAMFPQLIAGPIVRYRQIAAEIDVRVISNARLWSGVQLFVLGLSQKILIANPAAQVADYMFALAPAQLSAASAWIGAGVLPVRPVAWRRLDFRDRGPVARRPAGARAPGPGTRAGAPAASGRPGLDAGAAAGMGVVPRQRRAACTGLPGGHVRPRPGRRGAAAPALRRPGRPRRPGGGGHGAVRDRSRGRQLQPLHLFPLLG